jgi:hypothetical protein
MALGNNLCFFCDEDKTGCHLMLSLKYAYASTGNKLRMVRKFASEKIIKKKKLAISVFQLFRFPEQIYIYMYVYKYMSLETSKLHIIGSSKYLDMRSRIRDKRKEKTMRLVFCILSNITVNEWMNKRSRSDYCRSNSSCCLTLDRWIHSLTWIYVCEYGCMIVVWRSERIY